MVELNRESIIPDLERKFSLLETGITRAVEKIEALKGKNNELSESLRNAQSSISKLESSLDEYRSRAAEADKWQQEVRDLKQVKTLVTGKIEILLEKIDRINTQDP